MRGRILAVVVALFVVGTGCVSGADPTTTSTPASTTSAPVATTTTTVAAVSTTTTVQAVGPDLIFSGGPIVTMDSALETVEAIAITDDIIVAVGSFADISAMQGANTVTVDLDGRTVIPGIVDAHTHILTDIDGIVEGQRLALENGITSVGDASIEPDLPEVFAAADASGELLVRTSMYLTRTDACGEDLGLWYEAYDPSSPMSDRLRVAGIKVFADGGVCGGLATSEPIVEGLETAGPFQDLETLTGMITEADALGYQVLIHAQGDLAIANAQNAYEAVLAGRANELRHRIDHNVVATDAVISRYNDLGLVIALFGSSEACRPDLAWTDFYKDNGEEPGEIYSANPDSVVAWHGDDPWLTPISPMAELFSLVTRGRLADDGSICEPPDWMADEGVSVEQGLGMMTTGSAYALRQDDVVGSLTPGKFADLVVLSANPLEVAPSELPLIEYLMTMIGGSVEFCADGASPWCLP
jgi:predicted amidohydrolase YtcJ